MQCGNFGTHIVWNSSSVYFMLKFTEDFLNRLSRVVQRKASYGEIYQVTSGDGAPLQVVQKKPPPWIVSVKKKRRRRLSNLLHYWLSLNLHILCIRQMYWQSLNLHILCIRCIPLQHCLFSDVASQFSCILDNNEVFSYDCCKFIHIYMYNCKEKDFNNQCRHEHLHLYIHVIFILFCTCICVFTTSVFENVCVCCILYSEFSVIKSYIIRDLFTQSWHGKEYSHGFPIQILTLRKEWVFIRGEVYL